ncbi:MAG: hypothetical protein KFF72_19185 [Arthrospira sp. SH-MAG29]|nr:hypothetical protein [Arthrospira sp. SH-MAG29]MBS0018442.1 hypothetical protein [Arthrospira sp. SH-MAG29]
MTRPTARHENKYQPCPRDYSVRRRRRRRSRSPKYPREYTIALIKAIVIACCACTTITGEPVVSTTVNATAWLGMEIANDRNSKNHK